MIDLHIHLDGSLSREEVIELAEMSGLDIEEAKSAPLSIDSSCQTLNEYIECCVYPTKVMQTKETIEEAVYMLSSRLAKSGLLYFEIRFGPQLHIHRGLRQEEVVSSAIKGLRRAEKEYGILCQLILCAIRGDHNEEENFETIEVARKYYGKGVCGVDLAGAEAIYRTGIFAPVFLKAKEYGLPITIHAGEVGGPESVNEAINMGASRIGHGVRAVFDEGLLSYCANHDIAFELCPTSEVDTHAISSYDSLPIYEFLSKGIKVNINTDDMTISNITLKKEFEKLQKTFQFPYEIIEKLYMNAVDMAFLDEENKKILRSKIKKSLQNKAII